MKHSQQSIAAIALSLFAEHGVAATSIRDITEACQLSKAALYNHFPNKEAVLQFILERQLHHYATRFAQLVTTVTPGERLRQLIAFQFDYMNEHRSLFMLLYRERYSTSTKETDELFHQLETMLIDELAKTLHTLYIDSRFNQCYNIAFQLNAQINAYATLLLDGVALATNELTTYLLAMCDDLYKGLVARRSDGLLTIQPLTPLEQLQQLRDYFIALEENALIASVDLLIAEAHAGRVHQLLIDSLLAQKKTLY